MTTPRISMLSVEDARLAAASVKMHEATAELNIFRILLKHPHLAKMINAPIMNLIFRGKLDDRLRELIIMRLGWSTGSVYEWTQHWPIALDCGVPKAELMAVRNWSEHDIWSDLDRAILSATDEVVESGAVASGTWTILAKHLATEEELLEVVATIGTWNMVSQLLRSLNVSLEEGKQPWPPNGESPSDHQAGSQSRG